MALERRQPLRRSSELRRTPSASLRRRSWGIARSERREAADGDLRARRRELVDRLLRQRPVCEVPGCDHRSEHVHEVLTRARGGSIVDEDNCRAVCFACHRRIHDEPWWSEPLGLLVHSWDR